MNRRMFLASGAVAGLALVVRGWSRRNRPMVERACYAMGTTITIQAHNDDPRKVHHAITRAFEEFHAIDRLMSVFNPRSEVSRLNAAAGRNMIPVDDRVLEVLEHAWNLHKESGGYFNVLVEPLMRRWGFREEGRTVRHPPSDRELESILQAVRIGNLMVDRKGGRAGLRSRQSRVDLGGIAVGYSVDRAVRVLREEGIENAFINHSGDAFALGSAPEADGWPVMIPDPLHPDEPLAQFFLKDEALSTSGNSRTFVELDGRPYGHVFDPFIGKPAGRFLSLTIAAPTSLEADAWSTGFFSAGRTEERFKFLAVSGTEDRRGGILSHGI